MKKKFMFPVEKCPSYVKKIVQWRDDKVADNFEGEEKVEGGWIYLLVGYCPDTLPYFLGMVKEAQKTFPDLDLTDVVFGKVKESNWCKGFTLLHASISGPKRAIKGYVEYKREHIDFRY
jgi:hypothetical protein